MFRSLIIIGLGGFVGSVGRYLAALSINKQFSSVFPYGTLVVNITGCLLIGLFFGLAERGNLLTPEWRIFLTTGICGGFTTFSTFSYESINLMQDGEFLNLSLYVAISVIVGFAATYIGMLIIKSI